MKLKLTLFVFSLFLFNLCVSAQVKFVTQGEYDEIFKIKAQSGNQSRIVTQISSNFKDRKLVNKTKIVQEYESSKRNKWTYYEVVGDSSKITLEIIYYDDREFRRENEVEWKEIKRESSERMGFSGKELTNLKQYAISFTTFENKPVRIFSFYRVYDFGRYLNFYDSSIWVNSEGLVVKEADATSDMFPENIVHRSETTYLYNPKNLKIEPPIK